MGFILLLAALVLPQGVTAHHGWGWATDEEFEITGEVVKTHLGNPHGEVTIAVRGDEWVVEVGQPWRNERAGLTAALLSPGTVITAHGHRSLNENERLVKAERVVVDGEEYVLYPNRGS
jgi:hypothetical protein